MKKQLTLKGTKSAMNCRKRFSFLVLLIVGILISQSLLAQSYTYTPESFEGAMWASAPITGGNAIASSTGTWTTAKNNIQTDGAGLITPLDGAFSLILATKTNALITPLLENGVGVLTYNVIKAGGGRTIYVSTSIDKITWSAPIETFSVTLSTWCQRIVIINDLSVRYVKFEANSSGGVYLDNVMLTSAGSATLSVTTAAPTDIQQTSVLVGGTITSTGSDVITSRGVCYTSSTGYLDINSSKVEAAGTTGSFTVSTTNMTPNTTYRLKAYAISAKGVNYGPELTVTTRPVDVPTYWKQPFNDATLLPTSTTSIPAISFIVPDQGEWIYYGSFRGSNAAYIADGSGSDLRVPKNGTYVITPLLNSGVTTLSFAEGRGSVDLVIYTSTDGGATWTALKSVVTVRGSNTVNINDATVNRLKISNENGGDADIDNIIITAIPSGTQASVTTIGGSNIQKNSATVGGEVTNEGSKPPVTERGVCWSTTTFPFTADNKVSNGTGLGAFSCALTGLPAGSLIHIRGYAKTTAGTAYGNELTFTTLPATLPIITTTAASDIKGETVLSGGTITDNGGASINAQGVCWNTTGNPTTLDVKTSDSISTNKFQSLLKPLVPNTTYYYRAYATTVAGTGYGAVATFTTGGISLPVVTTAPVSSILYFKAKGSEVVRNDGGAWTVSGICWNTGGNPTITDTKTICGANAGSFSGTISNLTESTQYFVRAYATNSVGTVYGDVVVFTTPANPWLSAPIGYGQGTTGGGTPTANNTITVTNENELATALVGSKSVIYVFGTIQLSNHISAVINNKTIIGLPGATLFNPNRTMDGSGDLYLTAGSNNVIIRNLIFKGAGSYDCDGYDLLTNKGCTKLWVDHCEFQDGVDDSFDNSITSDSITISWCKFSDLIPYKSGGPGGSSDHRFANLIGGADEDAPADGHYSITFQNCWWSTGLVDRMARARNGELHFLNCYWNSQVAKNAIGFTGGVNGTSCYVEGGVFASTGTVAVIDGPQPIAITFADCSNAAGSTSLSPNITGGAVNAGPVSAPTYDYLAMPSNQVVSSVTSAACGAGATLQVAETGEISINCTPSPMLTASSNRVQEVYTGNSIVNISFIWGGTATDVTVTGLPAGLTFVKNTITKTLTITGIPATSGDYNVTTVGGTGMVTKQGTITVTTVPPPTISTPVNKSQTVVTGTAIESIVYAWGGGASDLTLSNLPTGLTSVKDVVSKTLTISGTPVVYGLYTVTTVGGTGNALSIQGAIKVKVASVVPKIAYVTNSTSTTYMNDTKILPALNADPNFDVTEVSSAVANNYNGYDLVLFSEVSGSTDPAVAGLEGLNKPFVMMKVNAYKSEAGAWNWATSGYSQSATETNIAVSDKTHPIFKNMTWINNNQIQVLSAVTGLKGLTYMDPSSFNSVSVGTITPLASIVGSNSQVCIFEIPAGTYVSGTLIPQKFIQIGINSSSYANVTDDGVKIVKNACSYLLGLISAIPQTYNNNVDKVEVYPTVARDVINIKAESTISSINIISIDGRLVSSIEPNSQMAQIKVANIKNGMYALIIKTEKSVTVTKVQVVK